MLVPKLTLNCGSAGLKAGGGAVAVAAAASAASAVLVTQFSESRACMAPNPPCKAELSVQAASSLTTAVQICLVYLAIHPSRKAAGNSCHVVAYLILTNACS